MCGECICRRNAQVKTRCTPHTHMPTALQYCPITYTHTYHRVSQSSTAQLASVTTPGVVEWMGSSVLGGAPVPATAVSVT